MREEKQKVEEITLGQAAVSLFDMWLDMMINGEVPDCKRYEDEFFEYYGASVASRESPLYMMFCSFIGAIDMYDYIDSEIGGTVNE